MNINDPTGRLFPPPAGGHFPPQPPRFVAPPPFNTAIPPPGFAGPQAATGWNPGPGGPPIGLPPPLHPTNEQLPANLPPRLQLQMLLQIPLTSSQQQQQQQHPSQLPSLLDPQPPYHPPPPYQQPPSYQGYNQPLNFGFPGLLSGSGGGNSIPGLGDTQDLERLRALESALKEASRGTWQLPGVAPPPAIPPQMCNPQEAGDAIVARQAEAFIRELQARGQMFDYKHGRRNDSGEPGRRRRRSSSSSSSGSDDDDFSGRKKRNRRDEGSDLEEGEVEDETPESRFLEHHRAQQQQQLPPPLFGSNQLPPPQQDYYQSTSHIAPLLPPEETTTSSREKRDWERDRGGRSGRRGKGNYRDLDAQEEEDEANNAQNVKEAAEKASGGKNSFDRLFSAYLSHKAKTSGKDDHPPPSQSPPPASSDTIAPLLKTLGPSLQQALSAVGIQVPVSSLGTSQQQAIPTTTATAPSLSYALSAFDRDIAQLGGPVMVATEQPKVEPTTTASLPPNVVVQVAGESSEWAAVAEEITSQLDKAGDQINQNQNLPREIHHNRDNRAVVTLVQRMIPLIPMVERENVAQRVAEAPDFSAVPLLLPAKILEERIFPPMKDDGRGKERSRRGGGGRGQRSNEIAAPGWSHSELHDKVKQARERVNHLKIEQAMVEERLIVMGDELRKLHRYFETNYGVKLVRPSDLEDPPELVALWKRREEDLRKKEAAAENDGANSDVASAVVYGPEPMLQEDSNADQPDENGPQEGQQQEGLMEDTVGGDQEGGEVVNSAPLKDRRDGGNRHREKHWRGKPHARANMRARVDAPDRSGNSSNSHHHSNRKGGPQRGSFSRGGSRH